MGSYVAAKVIKELIAKGKTVKKAKVLVLVLHLKKIIQISEILE
jgi:hypothetical protein